MKYFKSSRIEAVNFCSLGEKIWVIFFAFLPIFFLSECKPGDSTNTKNSADTTLFTKNDTTVSPHADSGEVTNESRLIIKEQLNILYTEADKMLRLIKLNTQGNTEGKIVFQYFVKKTGRLTLAAFSGDQHQTNFDKNNVLELDNSTLVVDKIPYGVFLGDQEFSKDNDQHHDDLTPLIREIRNHPKPGAPHHFTGFITFLPKVVPSLATNIQNSVTIEYSIGYAATLADIEDPSNLGTNKRITSIPGVSLNPSPPRNGY